MEVHVHEIERSRQTVPILGIEDSAAGGAKLEGNAGVIDRSTGGDAHSLESFVGFKAAVGKHLGDRFGAFKAEFLGCKDVDFVPTKKCHECIGIGATEP